ncbi:hypothetical protein K438DRAFT_1768339 [Mycena galopus ATCC 62051]|nr:hypothetical protein K438DRAFT_1768339 [Mycena galopus ATCC 62051]
MAESRKAVFGVFGIADSITSTPSTNAIFGVRSREYLPFNVPQTSSGRLARLAGKAVGSSTSRNIGERKLMHLGPQFSPTTLDRRRATEEQALRSEKIPACTSSEETKKKNRRYAALGLLSSLDDGRNQMGFREEQKFGAQRGVETN